MEYSSSQEKNEGILLLGGGGHCKAVIDVLELAEINIAGIVHGSDAPLKPVLGYPALGHDQDLGHLRALFQSAMVTVGQIKTPQVRSKLFEMLLRYSFKIPVIISPLAHLSPHSSVGSGSIVMHHALINAETLIGMNCIINSKALIEHECYIGNHCHIAVGALLCGGVTIEAGTFIGAGSRIKENIHIGNNCIIGMGSIIRDDVPNNSVINYNLFPKIA